MSRILCILPMRGGSERVPGKNLKWLGSKPLYSWILDTVTGIHDCDVVVDSDDQEILNAVSNTHRAVSLRKRPAELGESQTPMTSVIANVLEDFREHEWILQVHATNPFVGINTLNTTLYKTLSDKTRDSAFSTTRIQGRLWTEGSVALNHDPNILLRTQDLPPLFLENSSFYLFRRNVLADTSRRIGDRPHIVETSPLESLDIDYPEDFELANLVAIGLEAESVS